jgi:hypothetical protein
MGFFERSLLFSTKKKSIDINRHAKLQRTSTAVQGMMTLITIEIYHNLHLLDLCQLGAYYNVSFS